MASTNNKSKNLVDLMLENQSNIMDQVIETSKKITKDHPIVQETIDKGHNLYKDLVKKTSDIVEDTTKKFNETANEMKEKSENVKNYFEQWFENQMNWAKNTFNTNNNFTPNFNSGFDWMNNWQNWTQQQNSYWNNAFNSSPFNWMNNNPFSGAQNKMNDGLNQWAQYTKQYFELMNSGNSEWWKQFSNVAAADSYKGMANMSESLSKFYELWIPMFKSIQDKTFNLNNFNQYLNPEKYKEFIDKFFHFMPDAAKKSMEQYNQQFIQSMKQMSEAGLNNYRQFQSQYQNSPWTNANPFNQMMEMYNNWRNAMNEAVSPLSRLFEPNSNVQQAQTWNEINDHMIQFNLKNNELQYMMYQHGLKVMEQVAENVAGKIEKGETIESIVKVFQDWLMTGDDVFGKLFQSDAYSKLMTEVSSLQLKIKQEVDKQMEKLFFVNIPVATRSEMDEVYKNLYDLKKMYKQMEKILNADKPELSKTPKKK